MVLGSFLAIPSIHIWVNNGGAMTHVDHTQDNVIEMLITIAGCPLFWWVHYTSGDPLPNRAVVGGYISDGTATYIALTSTKARHGTARHGKARQGKARQSLFKVGSNSTKKTFAGTAIVRL